MHDICSDLSVGFASRTLMQAKDLRLVLNWKLLPDVILHLPDGAQRPWHEVAPHLVIFIHTEVALTSD